MAVDHKSYVVMLNFVVLPLYFSVSLHLTTFRDCMDCDANERKRDGMTSFTRFRGDHDIVSVPAVPSQRCVGCWPGFHELPSPCCQISDTENTSVVEKIANWISY
jgi:hypothetical protein